MTTRRMARLAPVMVLLLGLALSVILMLSPTGTTIQLVNYTNPVVDGVDVEADYIIQYVIFEMKPEDTRLVLDIARDCNQPGKEVALGPGRTGQVDLEPGESVCRIYATNEKLLIDYLPPSRLEARRPGVLEIAFTYPTVTGLARLEFGVQKVRIEVYNTSLSGKLRLEWITEAGSVYEDHQCDTPCDIEASPPRYSTSINVYIVTSRTLIAIIPGLLGAFSAIYLYRHSRR